MSVLVQLLLAQAASSSVALTSLRPGEAALVSAALGDVGSLTFYQADLAVDVEARKLSGTVSVAFTPRRALAELYLRVAPNLGAHPESVVLAQAQIDGVRHEIFQPDASLYHVKLRARIAAGQRTTLVLRIGARLPESDSGAFFATDGFVSLLGLLPRLVEQNSDGELSEGSTYERAHWLVSTVVARGYRVAAPGVLLGHLPEASGGERFTFACAAAEDFGVFITRGYEVCTAENAAAKIEVWASPRHRQAAHLSLQLAAHSMVQFEERLPPYPLTHLRLLEVPLPASVHRLELPGLIAISSASMSSTRAPRNAAREALEIQSPQVAGQLEMAVMQGIAHQYTAALVKSAQTPVADDALAQYLAVLGVEWRRGKKASKAMAEQHLARLYLEYRSDGGADGPVLRLRSEFADDAEYEAMVLAKAPGLFEAQRRRVGDAVWLGALRKYLRESRYRAVDGRAFEETLEVAAPKQAVALQPLRRRWWEQSYGDEDLGKVKALNPP